MKYLLIFTLLFSLTTFGQHKFTLSGGTSSGYNGSSGSLTQGVYNVKSYGALGNGVANDQVAIQLALNACAAGGGGTVYIPNGIYILSGALVTSVGGKNPNSQLYIPLTSSSGEAITIKILGETPPAVIATGLIDGFPVPVSGSILKSTILGSNTYPAVIGSTAAITPFGSYNFTHIEIENITVRTRSQTAGVEISSMMCGINLGRFQTAAMKCVRIDTDSEAWFSIQPHVSAVGLITPFVSNAAWSYFERVMVTGYYNGILVNEHTNLVNVAVFCCYNGLRMDAGSHNAVAERVLIQWCRNNLFFNGRLAFWGSIDTENYGTTEKWYKNVYDCVNGTGAKIEASIVFNRVVSGVPYASNNAFVQSGIPINAVPLGKDIMWGVNGSATLDFPSTPAQSSSEITFLIGWAVAGEPAIVSPPVAAHYDNSFYTARVISNNTVGVTFHNYSSQAIDPASAIFKVSVIKN